MGQVNGQSLPAAFPETAKSVKKEELLIPGPSSRLLSFFAVVHYEMMSSRTVPSDYRAHPTNDVMFLRVVTFRSLAPLAYMIPFCIRPWVSSDAAQPATVCLVPAVIDRHVVWMAVKFAGRTRGFPESDVIDAACTELLFSNWGSYHIH